MKIRLDKELSDLDDLRKRIGASYKEFHASGLETRDPEIEIIKLLSAFVEIDPSEVETSGPFLTYQRVQAILYIKDTMQTIQKIRYEKDTAKKFHVVWCRTLQQKNHEGTFQSRYVMTRRTDGVFKVDAFQDDSRSKKIESEEELLVCQNCLTLIDYKGFRKISGTQRKRKAVRDFDIQEFLDEYEGVVRYLSLPTGTDKTEPLADYTEEYVRRAQIVKQQAKYRCGECGVDLKGYKKFLHCHHKNHRKYDNRWTNLIAICALCHRDKHHKEMRIPREAEDIISKIRARNKL